MLSFKERLDLLENDLARSPLGFIISQDLPFAIFRYNPSDPQEKEFQVRDAVRRLATRVKAATSRNVYLISLARMYWHAIDFAEEEALDALSEFEKEYGFSKAEEQVHTFLSDRDYTPLPQLVLDHIKDQGYLPEKDLIFLMRAAVFAPSSYRVSSLLEQLMGRLKVPTVLFYPGTWHGTLNYLGLQEDNQPQGTYRVKVYGRDA